MELGRLLVAPVYAGDPERSALARIFHVISVAIALAMGAATFINLFSGQTGAAILLSTTMVCTGALIVAARLGHLRIASSLLPPLVLASSSGLLLIRDGVHDNGVVAIAGMLVICGVLLSRRALVILTVAGSAIVLAIGYAEIAGLLHNRFSAFTDVRHLVGVCLVFVVMAITGRFVAESLLASLSEVQEKSAALGASEARYRTLVEVSPDAMYIISDERFVFVNAHAARLYGAASAQDLIGRRILDLIHPDARPLIAERIARLDRGEPLSRIETRILRLDGSIVDVEAASTPFQYEGKPAFQAVVRDITDRRRAERLLEESEARLAKMIDASPEAITIASVEDGTFILVNPAGERLCGYTSDELIGSSALELGFYADPEERRRIVADLQRDEVVHGREIRLRRKNGEIRDMLASAALIDFRGRKLILFQGIDITERKSAEKALREHEELLRELSAHHDSVREGERAHIAREIHDELGQALTALRMDLSVLAMKFGHTVPPIQEQVRELKSQVDAIIRVVRDVATALRPAALDLGILAGIEWLAEEFRRRSGIPCTVSVAGRDIALGEARSIVLFRIVQESLTNVSRHARAHKVEILLDRDAEFVRLDVQDDGVGFGRESRHGARTYGLLGMKERALMLGGELRITSAHGHGTRVSVCIPVA